jgi:hypothetical protein
MAKGQSTTIPWRDRITVHPACELFPPLPEDELRALGKDIDEHGLTSPLIFWLPGAGPGPDDAAPDDMTILRDAFLLDGRNRLDGIELVGGRSIFDAETGELLPPRAFVYEQGGGFHDSQPCDPWEYVISANIRRRHLSSAQKQELIGRVLQATPERSNRATAAIVQADHKTVGVVRQRLEATGEIPQLAATTGADGRTRRTNRPILNPRPAGSPPRTATAEKPEPAPEPQEQQQVQEPQQEPMAQDETPAVAKIALSVRRALDSLAALDLPAAVNVCRAFLRDHAPADVAPNDIGNIVVAAPPQRPVLNRRPKGAVDPELTEPTEEDIFQMMKELHKEDPTRRPPTREAAREGAAAWSKIFAEQRARRKADRDYHKALKEIIRKATADTHEPEPQKAP